MAIAEPVRVHIDAWVKSLRRELKEAQTRVQGVEQLQAKIAELSQTIAWCERQLEKP